MAKSLKLTFEGLCEFVIRDTAAEVYVPDGGGIHGQFLIIRSDFLNVPSTEWMPTFVALIRDFDEVEQKVLPKQIAIWSLESQDVTFTRDGATGAPKWKNRKFVIDFKTEHDGASAKARDEIREAYPKVGIVTLIGDQTELDPEEGGSNDRFTLKKKNGDSKTGTFSRLVHWEAKGANDHRIFNRQGEKIALRKDVNAWATVSNAAPVPAQEGLAHFGHHYEGVKLDDNDEPMKVEQALANVFDCVPPTAWP